MSPMDTQNIMDRARGSARLGDHAETERLLKQYLQKNSKDREALLLLGSTYAKSGKLDDALDVFLSLLGTNPDDLEALNNMAVIYRKKEQYEKALDALEHAIDLDPTRTELHYNLGNVYKQLGNYKAASMAYAKVIELDPRYVPAYNNLGTMYDKLQDWDKAFAIFQKGLSLDRNNPVLHFNFGLALEAKGRFEEAVKEYETALRSRPGWVEALNNLGIIRLKQGRHTEALEIFNRILTIDPFNSEARNNVGVVLADQGKFNDAIQYYRQAIEADPKYVKAVVNLEHALEAIGHPGDALLELEKLVKLVPNSTEVRIKLGGLYLKLQRYPEALEQVSRALEWDRDNIQALRIQGAAYRAMGQDAEAQGCFERIIAIEPGNYSFYLDLADLHFQRKEYKEAEERILAFLRRKPQDRNAKLMLGRLYAESGNKAHAVAIFEELIKDNPQDEEALAALAEIHKKSGDIEKAVRTAHTLINLQGKRATSEDLSNLNKSLEFYEEAVRSYSASLQGMWERNLRALKHRKEIKAVESPDETNPLLLSAIDSIPVDEETDNLFIEEFEETIDEPPEDEKELVLDDETYALFDEPSEPDDSFEGLIEPDEGWNMSERPATERPVPETPPPMNKTNEPSSEPVAPQQPEPAPLPQSPQIASLPPIQVISVPTAIPPYTPPPVVPPGPIGTRPLYPSSYPPPEQAPGQTPQKQPEASWAPPQPEQKLPKEKRPAPEPIQEPSAEEPLSELPLAEQALSDLDDENMADLLEYPAENELSELGDEEEFLEYLDELPENELWDDSIILDDDEDLEELEEVSPPGETELPEGDNPVQSEQPLEQAPEQPKQPIESPLEQTASQAPEKDETPRSLSESAMLNLFQYLKDLTEELPEDQKRAFRVSEARLKMEYVIDKLEGHKGLFKGLQEKNNFKKNTGLPSLSGKGPDPESVVKTLAYLSGLSKTLPDRDLSRVIEKKVDTVVKGLIPDGGHRE